ncbi:hypothetical protein [Vitiosangium sp. GDMCC 1.1324]|uniref:hypothetical protein n=1 Tax=Vitiosangium sp. (strain GDMCC 1.1324) TaxID=2138576 RepID=UPI000D382CD1|nr:hypothetical protein [Vitiosangium sp. GDMCC 1.1324]PTL83882.1 hypothetical protein DAT35_10495 [Vitiosangium sp. GDMCC 1.1324]
MKAALIVMGVMLLGVVGLAAWRGGWPLVSEGLMRGGKESLALLPLLAVVFLLTGFVQVLLPRELVANWLSDEAGWRGIGVAWVAGALTPGGGPIGMPLAAALVRSGAGLGVVVTYLTSLSLLSFIRVPMEIAIYGGRLTGVRLLISLALPPMAGLLAQALGPLLLGRT